MVFFGGFFYVLDYRKVNKLYLLLCVSVVHTLGDPAELPGTAALDRSSTVLRAESDVPLPAAE